MITRRNPHRRIATSVLALVSSLYAYSGLALTGNAPRASGWTARAIVMVVDPNGDLCTGTALTRKLVLTAAHCVAPSERYEVKAFHGDEAIAISGVARHPRFDIDSYRASRATADIALLKLAAPLPNAVVPAALAVARRVKVGETLTIAGFGTTAAGGDRGLGQPRMAKLIVTGRPGSLQIRLYDPATRNARPGLGACNGNSGGPAFDAEAPLVVGVVSWTTAANDEAGCGGLTGLTPLLKYREWILQTAKRLGAPLQDRVKR